MLFKIAELWADKKRKIDRAARAYEKVLELDRAEPPRRRSPDPDLLAGEQPKGSPTRSR